MQKLLFLFFFVFTTSLLAQEKIQSYKEGEKYEVTLQDINEKSIQTEKKSKVKPKPLTKAPVTKTFGEIYNGKKVPCAHNKFHDELMDTDASYKKGVESTEQTIQKKLSSISAKTGGSYTIPVVFHVIHEGEDYGEITNITDEQIQSSLDALNRDFAASDEDGGVAQSSVAAAQGDTEIRFCLAQRDPDGNPHTGINRIDGTVVAGYADNGITNTNEVDVKDLSRWDNRYYMNVWVVTQIDGNGANTPDHTSWGGGVLGYAYFPTNPVTNNAARDGIVQISICTGNDPDGSAGHRLWPPTVLNRTLTHEVGHYLNLYHTFEGSSCTESDCASEGDLCCDTPPTVQNTDCNDPACGGTQQVENYMDYTGDACYEMFSADQTTRMTAVIDGVRNDLVNTSNCTPPVDWDVEISSIIHPEGETCGDNFSPIVRLRNNGANTVTSVDIEYDINGGGAQTYSWSGSLESSQSVNVTLPELASPTGTNTFNATTVSGTINGSNTDENTDNDAASSTYTISTGVSVELEIVTDDYGFETAWQLEDESNTVIHEGGNLSVIPGGNQSASPEDDGAYNNNSTITYSWCLSEGCYNYTIYDDWGDGICCDYGNGSYTITNLDDGSILASGGDFGVSETVQICVSEEDGPPAADFTASSTSVLDGGSVDLIDQSTGNPSPDTWLWEVTGPGTATIDNEVAQNTSVQFDGIGLYTVSLTVSNTEGQDTETKVDYIEVIEDNGECIELSNFLDTDNYASYNTGDGYVTGQNQYDMDAYAEPFNVESETQVQRLVIAVARSYDATGTSSFNFNVYEDNGGLPGAVLGTQEVLYSDLEEAAFNNVIFNDPVSVNGDFWVGFSFDPNAEDSIALYSAEDREPNTTHIRFGGTWDDLNTIYSGGLSTSMGIDVFLSSGAPVASFTQEETQICEGESIVFDATSSERALDYEWSIVGATPETSTEAIETFTFVDEGTYNVELTVSGGCYTDQATSTVTVNKIPELSAGDDQFICDGESVTLTATNPDDAAISWDNDVIDGEAFTPSVGAVTYTVNADLLGCRNTDDVLVEVNPLPTASIIGSIEVCEDDSEPEITFIGEDGTPPYTYTYSLNGGTPQTITSDGSGFAIISVSTATPGTYEYELLSVEDSSTSSCSQAQSGSAEVIVNQAPTFTLAGTDPSECGENDGFITISGLQADETYEVSYNDNAPTTLTSDGSGDIIIANLTAGSYINIEVSRNNCSTTNTTGVTLEDPGAPTVDAGEDFSSCEGEAITLTASNPDEANITWSDGIVDGEAFVPASGTNTYTVTAELDACINEDVITVTVNPSPSIEAIDDISECGEITLPTIEGVNLSGNEAYYTESNGQGQSFDENETIFFEDFDNYPMTLYIYDETGSCSDEVSFEITITDPTTTITCPDNDGLICTLENAPVYETLQDFIDGGGNVAGVEVASFGLVNAVSDEESCPETVTRTYEVVNTCDYSFTCDHIILIGDDEAPEVTCETSSDTLYLSEGSESPDYTPSVSAQDNCSEDVSFNQDPVAGSDLEIGDNTVIITVSDECGNSSTCEINVVLVDDELSLAENESQKVSLYPNPTSNEVAISLEGWSGEIRLNLVDVNGKVLLEQRVINTNETIDIDLSNYAKGVYYVNILSSESVVTKKISKM